MASKGPKPVGPKRSTKPLGIASESKADAPPVPFVAQPAATPPLPEAVLKRASAKPSARSSASSKPAAPIMATPPAPVAATASIVPSPVEPVKVAAEPVAPEPVVPEPVAPAAITPDPVPAESITPDFIPPATPTPAIAPATAITQKDTRIMDATTNTAAEAAQTQAKTMFADANDRAKTAMEKGSKMIAELSEFSKGNLEAVVESSKIAAKGAEDIARYTSDYVRNSVEKASTTASQFASIKSPTEFFKLHSEMTKQAMDSMMAETAKFTEGYVKLLGEIAQPISNRVAVAVEKVKVAA